MRGLWLAAAAVFATSAAAPALADGPEAVDLSSRLPPPADIGKPRVFAVQPYLPLPDRGGERGRGCAAALPCGTRVIGSTQRRDAIAVEVPALRW